MNKAGTPTIRRRPADQRGTTDLGWLRSRHSFSFGDYFDPGNMGFRTLRVLNDDHVAPGRGFPTHPHRDMEIFSYVLSGRLAHRDSMGHGRELRRGQIQLMSAGSGVTHSERNPSETEATHFLQVWIQPRAAGLEPGYTEWTPSAGQLDAPQVLVISPDGRDGSAKIHQDALVYRLLLVAGQSVTHEVAAGRGVWIQVAAGSLEVNGERLSTGDGGSTEYPGTLEITAQQDAEALLFDLR